MIRTYRVVWTKWHENPSDPRTQFYVAVFQSKGRKGSAQWYEDFEFEVRKKHWRSFVCIQGYEIVH